MGVLRFIAPTLAVVAGAYAQCSVSATTTVSDAAGATAIAGCATFTGSIAMASSANGYFNFDGVRRIEGAFTSVDTSNITAISAQTLQAIDGLFSLVGLTQITSLTFPELTSVGSLNWVTLGPNLGGIGFTLDTVPGNFTIQDTYLPNLNGISMMTASSVTIASNRFLMDISIPLTSIGSGGLLVTGNAAQPSVSLPNLATSGSIDIRNTSSLDLSGLNNVTSGFSATGNSFSSLTLANLTMSNGFSADNNNMMTNISLPKYTSSTGAFSVSNNTALTGNLVFPKLSTVVGTVSILGDFMNLSMPALTSVQGGMTIISTEVLATTCEHFDSISGPNDVIQGMETCSPSATADATNTGSSDNPTDTSAASPSATTGAAMNLEASPASMFTVFGLLAAAFELMM